MNRRTTTARSPRRRVARGGRVLLPSRPTGNAIPGDATEFTQTWEQSYRVADTSLERYELYVGEDGPPDFEASGQPVATSTTLPFTWSPTPPASGDTKDLHLVVRKRNRYGLLSFNVFERVLTIDSGGVEIVADPSPPFNVAAYDAAEGYLRVLATYERGDDPSPADTWDVYVKEGADPVIGVDAVAATRAMAFVGDAAALTVEVGPYTPGATAHILVVARRDSDDATASAGVLQKALAEALELDPGEMFGGDAFEQRG